MYKIWECQLLYNSKHFHYPSKENIKKVVEMNMASMIHSIDDSLGQIMAWEKLVENHNLAYFMADWKIDFEVDNYWDLNR